MESNDTYALGRSDAETRRLIFQHQIYAPATRRFFEAAGIGRGMKVLDLGSGAGDVALLVADLVGPEGSVVGVDMNEGILATARARADVLGRKQVTFVAGNLEDIGLDTDFDAVVGRWVLMYLRDPAATVRRVASHLKVGGIVAFHENDFSYPPTVFPPSELSRQVQAWTIPPLDKAPVEMQMGTKLFRTYVEAGLPAPQLLAEAPCGGGPDWPGYEYLTETFRSLLPMLQKMQGLDPAAVDIDTLAARYRDDVVSRNAIQFCPIMFGAWARKPA